MEEAKTMKTPMSSSIKLNKDEKGKSIDSTMYRGMIGSLLYLTTSRPDIMYSVCLCAIFQSCPKKSHLSACGPSPDPPDRRDSLLKEKKENEKKVGVFQF